MAKIRPGLTCLLGKAEHSDVIAECRSAADKIVCHTLSWLSVSMKQPQIPARGVANNRPCVILRMIQNPIVSDIERPEKTDFELGVACAGNDLGCSMRRAQPAIRFPACIDNAYSIVGKTCVCGSNGLTPSLEALLISSDFMPKAEIPIEINRVGGFRYVRVAYGMPLVDCRFADHTDDSYGCHGTNGGPDKGSGVERRVVVRLTRHDAQYPD